MGAAVGDAFGMPLEFAAPRTYDRFVDDFEPGRLPAGHFTDDTEMTLALADGILAKNPLDPDEIAKRFADWFRSRPPDMGLHTAKVLSRIAKGEDWRIAAESVHQDSPAWAGNGSVMRVVPAVLANAGNLSACLEACRLQGRVTHAHPECDAACTFAGSVLWHALQGDSPAEAVDAGLSDVSDLPSELREAIEKASTRQPSDFPNTGWVRHTIESAVWGFRTSLSFTEAIVKVGNLGNDADTASTMAGAFAGAAYGRFSIPAGWRERVHGEWPVGSGRIVREGELIRLADALVEAAG